MRSLSSHAPSVTRHALFRHPFSSPFLVTFFVASYKYALLLALAELSVEKPAAADGALRIELPELAERFITLYWRQVAPFGMAAMLAQNAGKQASVVTKIAAFKTHAPTLVLARSRALPFVNLCGASCA